MRHGIGRHSRFSGLQLLAFTLVYTAQMAGQDAVNPSVPTHRPETRIQLGITITPNLSTIRQSSTILVTLWNQNSLSTQALQPGDVFNLLFDLGDGQLQPLPASAVTTSNSFSPSHFQLNLANGGTQLLITYIGPTMPFGPQDFIAVKLSVLAPSQVRSSRIIVELPDYARFASTGAQSAVFSSVDFTFSPPGTIGPDGPSGPQGLTGPQGPAGIQGSAGPQGPSGADGREGPGGPAGPPGPPGLPGAPGTAGATGQPGPAGPPGATGPVGPPGSPGSAGAAFTTGILNRANTTPFWTTLTGASQEESTFAGQMGGAMPIACTFSSLTLSLYGVSGTGATNTLNVTLYKNGLPTSMTASLANPGQGLIVTATDNILAHQFSVAVGDFVSIGYTQTSSTSAVRIGVATRCQSRPYVSAYLRICSEASRALPRSLFWR